MASSSSALSFAPLPSSSLRSHRRLRLPPLLSVSAASSSSITRFRSLLRASSRKSPNYPQDSVAVVPDPRPWVRDFAELNDDGDEGEEEEEEEEEEDDRSLDLLARFLHNLFRKISRRARKQARSLLPPSIPTKLVGFSVNGVLVLGFLWILKALLEVVCAVGSTVFVSILLVRGIWSGISHIKEHQYYNYITRMDCRNSTWNGAQPAS